jgi:hypothetical protein
MCKADGATKVSAKQLKQRLTERGVGVRDGDWAHGGELIVTARVDIRSSEESRSAAAYDKQGLDALAAEDFEAAAKAFVAVMHADAKAWKGPYNLACAYARAEDPRAPLALEVAVERGGDAVREKAAKDADLDAVRSQAWFTALIGAGE